MGLVPQASARTCTLREKACMLIVLSMRLFYIIWTSRHCISLYTDTYIHTYIHTYMHACIHTYIHTYIYKYIHIHMLALAHTDTVSG